MRRHLLQTRRFLLQIRRGRTLDALADCLRDLVGDTLLLWGNWAGLAENDPAAMAGSVHGLGSAERLAAVLVDEGPELDVPALS